MFVGQQFCLAGKAEAAIAVLHVSQHGRVRCQTKQFQVDFRDTALLFEVGQSCVPDEPVLRALESSAHLDSSS